MDKNIKSMIDTSFEHCLYGFRCFVLFCLHVAVEFAYCLYLVLAPIH
jgi:hypothetical protein